jgi:hypothetical protein
MQPCQRSQMRPHNNRCIFFCDNAQHATCNNKQQQQQQVDRNDSDADK